MDRARQRADVRGCASDGLNGERAYFKRNVRHDASGRDRSEHRPEHAPTRSGRRRMPVLPQYGDDAGRHGRDDGRRGTATGHPLGAADHARNAGNAGRTADAASLAIRPG
jgi:hypothetical protein